ncbi:hypothetical protein [Halorussus salinisoli]|uniref:hypothetical protein n=1 Tax=Halorussus salinisoli TaxID=2558242 RepID=UPI0010C1AB03|nr:hypothetical protein [Halorussus salinisoli]
MHSLRSRRHRKTRVVSRACVTSVAADTGGQTTSSEQAALRADDLVRLARHTVAPRQRAPGR